MFNMNSNKNHNLKNIALVIVLCALGYNYFMYDYICLSQFELANHKSLNNNLKYDRSEPIIFVGGVPRSGTTLMRVMLDAHPLIRCGEETRILPRIIFTADNLKNQYINKTNPRNGLTGNVIDNAIASFMLEIIIKHGQPSKYFCNKDPFVLKFPQYVSQLFPNSKFILMIRDGRATLHSIMTRKVTISGFELGNYRSGFQTWNRMIEGMFSNCMVVGAEFCLPVYYEQLVLHPEREMKKILNFLNIKFDTAVLNHEKFIGDEISLSKFEKSSDQVVKPVNLEALTSWIGKIPQDALNNIDVLAPMMKILGYDTKANRPNYGIADKKILDNTLNVQKNRDFWLKIAKNYSIHV